jgi:hypothetical protein
MSTPPTPSYEASQIILNDMLLRQSGYANTGALVSICLVVSSASWHFKVAQ